MEDFSETEKIAGTVGYNYLHDNFSEEVRDRTRRIQESIFEKLGQFG